MSKRACSDLEQHTLLCVDYVDYTFIFKTVHLGTRRLRVNKSKSVHPSWCAQIRDFVVPSAPVFMQVRKSK